MLISDWSSDVCASYLQRIAASRGQGQQARIWMDRWVPMCMIGAYGLRQGDGGLFWRLRGRVKVAYSRWFPRPSPVEPRSITAFSIAAVLAATALALRVLAGAFDWQIPVWQTFFLATLVATAWVGRSEEHTSELQS